MNNEPNPTEQIKLALSGVGASKIIYALVMPETEAVKRRVFNGNLSVEFERLLADSNGHILDVTALLRATDRASAPYFDSFREAWTQKQDAMHLGFFELWLDWVSSIVSIPKDEFTYLYPTAGASEGLRAVIDEYGARARRDGFEPEIHLFEGEYEGFAAYADAAYIKVIKHNRGNWRQAVSAISIASVSKPVQFYISQPSAIDGNIWNDYESFVADLAARAPRAEVIVDLTYVGCVGREFSIRADFPNTPTIIFSLSKPMGAYYDRIGGVIAKPRDGREPYPALFGNKWFKNLTSLAIGTEFMKSFTVRELPTKYASAQQEAIKLITARLAAQGHDVSLTACDVFLLAVGEMPANPTDIHRYLERTADGRGIVRVCLTPTMAPLIGTASTYEVSPRYYEKI